MTIIGLICLILSGIFFYLGIQTHYKKVTDGIPVEPKYVAENKYFGQPVALTETVTPKIVAIQYFVKKYGLDKGTDEEKVIKTFDLFERKGVYFYTNDNTIKYENENVKLGGFSDVWEKPILILAEFEKKGRISVDCETGSMLLASLFLAEGIDAREVLGEVNVPGKGIYGHGWCIVKLDGSWKLIESTRGKPLQRFIPVPKIYKPLFIFTDKHVEAVNGAKMEDVENKRVNTLTPEGVKALNEYLDSLE